MKNLNKQDIIRTVASILDLILSPILALFMLVGVPATALAYTARTGTFPTLYQLRMFFEDIYSGFAENYLADIYQLRLDVLYDRILDALSSTKEKAVQTTTKVKNASVQASCAVTDTIKSSSVRLMDKTKTAAKVVAKTFVQGLGTILVAYIVAVLTLTKAVLSPFVVIYAVIKGIIESRNCIRKYEVFEDEYTRILVNFLDWGLH